MSSGGAEHQLTEIVNSLVNQEFEIEVATFADIPDHYELDSRVKRIRIGSRKSNFIKLLLLWKYILLDETNIVFCFGQRESLFALLPLLFTKKKFFVGERNTHYGILSFAKKFKLGLLYKIAYCIIPNSFTQGEFIAKNFPFASKKIQVITNYTDIDIYNNPNYPNREMLKICVFARYSEQKNYKRFAKAIKELVRVYPISFHIDWFGNKQFKNEGFNPNYIEFQNLISEYNLKDRITLQDSIKDVHTRMREYDAFCLPSLYEGFSNSISEAISCGLPSIVSEVSDNSLMVKDGVNGFLFNPLDVESMKNALLKFLKLSYSERKKMSENSRQIAESLFDKKVFIDQYKNLFKI